MLLPNVDGIVCAHLDKHVRIPNGWSRTVDMSVLPAGRVVRYGGGPQGYPLWLDRAEFQGDVWALSARDADRVLYTALAAVYALPGRHELGVVSSAEVRNVGYAPDVDWPDSESGGAMPHWRFDFTVLTHPLG